MKTAEYHIDAQKIKAISEEDSLKPALSIKLVLIQVFALISIASIAVIQQSDWVWLINSFWVVTYTEIAFRPLVFLGIVFVIGLLFWGHDFWIKSNAQSGEVEGLKIEWGYNLPSTQQHVQFLQNGALLIVTFLPMICGVSIISAILPQVSTYGGFFLLLIAGIIVAAFAIIATVIGGAYLMEFRASVTQTRLYQKAYMKTKNELNELKKQSPKVNATGFEAQIEQLNIQLDQAEKLHIDYCNLQQDLQLAYRLIEGRKDLKEAAKETKLESALAQPWRTNAFVRLNEAQEKGIVRLEKGGKKAVDLTTFVASGNIGQSGHARQMRSDIRDTGGEIFKGKNFKGAAFAKLSDMAQAGYVLKNPVGNLPKIYIQEADGHFTEIDPKQARNTQDSVCNQREVQCEFSV